MAADTGLTERRPREDGLADAVTKLEAALATLTPGQERTWATGLEGALASLEEALKRHLEAAEGPDGFLVQVDLTRPSLTRKVGQLRAEHRTLPESTRLLRQQVTQLRRAFEPDAARGNLAKPLPAPEETTSSCDPGAVRQAVERLLAALRQHREWEVDLLLESVDTDLGAGD